MTPCRKFHIYILRIDRTRDDQTSSFFAIRFVPKQINFAIKKAYGPDQLPPSVRYVRLHLMALIGWFPLGFKGFVAINSLDCKGR